MKIAVTGAGGFIGRVVVDRLLETADTEVIALSRGDVPGKNCTEFLKWTSTDYSEDSLNRILEGVDAVVHLAGTKGGKKELSEYESDRVMTENILKAMVLNKVQQIIYASSRMVYANPETLPWREDTEREPVTAYGKNKVLLEDMCRTYAEDNGLNCVVLRIAQVLGIGEGTRTMINVFQDIARAKGEITVIGKSVAKRQYVYTKDIAEAIIRVINTPTDGYNVINLGMENAYSNLEIAEAINEAFGNPTPINYDDSTPETITSSYMNVDRLISEIGLKPMDMVEALRDMY